MTWESAVQSSLLVHGIFVKALGSLFWVAINDAGETWRWGRSIS